MLLERYILLEWLKVFLLTLGLMMGLLVLQIIYDDLEDLIHHGAGVDLILIYFSIQIPVFLPTVLPVTFLISILIALGGLHQRGEIIALRAGGVSLWTLSRGLWGIGLVLSLLLLALTSQVVPWSVEQSRMIRDNLRFGAEGSQAVSVQDPREWTSQLAFFNQAAGRTWMINHFNRRTFVGRGISVHEENRMGVEVSRWEAREGYFDDRALQWIFLRGRQILSDPETGEPLRLLPFDRLVISDWSERPELMLALRQRPKDLSLFELETILYLLPPGENPISIPHAVRYQIILASPFVCVLLVAIGVPFAIRGVRINPLVGASKSVGIFFAFYLVSNIFSVLGERALIDPFSAAWIPLALLLISGAWILARSR